MLFVIQSWLFRSSLFLWTVIDNLIFGRALVPMPRDQTSTKFKATQSGPETESMRVIMIQFTFGIINIHWRISVAWRAPSHNSEKSDIWEYTNYFKICGVRRIEADSDRSFCQPRFFQTKSPAILPCTILRTTHLFLYVLMGVSKILVVERPTAQKPTNINAKWRLDKNTLEVSPQLVSLLWRRWALAGSDGGSKDSRISTKRHSCSAGVGENCLTSRFFLQWSFVCLIKLISQGYRDLQICL